jgi:hypothetical protein
MTQIFSQEDRKIGSPEWGATPASVPASPRFNPFRSAFYVTQAPQRLGAQPARSSDLPIFL